MDVSNLNDLKEVGKFIDNLDTRPTELVISKDMAKAIETFRVSSYPVGEDIRFRSILCKVKEEHEPED